MTNHRKIHFVKLNQECYYLDILGFEAYSTTNNDD